MMSHKQPQFKASVNGMCYLGLGLILILESLGMARLVIPILQTTEEALVGITDLALQNGLINTIIGCCILICFTILFLVIGCLLIISDDSTDTMRAMLDPIVKRLSKEEDEL